MTESRRCTDKTTESHDNERRSLCMLHEERTEDIRELKQAMLDSIKIRESNLERLYDVIEDKIAWRVFWAAILIMTTLISYAYVRENSNFEEHRHLVSDIEMNKVEERINKQMDKTENNILLAIGALRDETMTHKKGMTK